MGIHETRVVRNEDGPLTAGNHTGSAEAQDGEEAMNGVKVRRQSLFERGRIKHGLSESRFK
jgi:hypothetical protein